MNRFDLVGFDADDTLWHSEDGFQANEAAFAELVAPYAPPGIDVRAALTGVERANLGTYGYGVKAFALSMVEAALTITGGELPGAVLGQLLDNAKSQLQDPVRLLAGVPAVLAAVSARHTLALITKGDLIHQTHKIATSGLAHHFAHVEVVLEKDVATYARLLERFDVAPERFCMVGNSVRSDILPVMALGGTGVHVPYPLLWELERIDHDEHVIELASLADLPGWLAQNG